MHWYGVPDPLAMPLAKFFRFHAEIAEIEEYKSGDGNSATAALRKMMRG